MIDERPTIGRIRGHLAALEARRVVLYGYTRPTHTHHWVMQAVHRALELALRESNITLHWVSNAQAPPADLLDRAVVFGNLNTDHVDWSMPLVAGATYVLHNHHPDAVDTSRYQALVEAGRCTFYAVYRGRPGPEYSPIDGEPCHFESLERADQVITWATDLLPGEIQENADRVSGLDPDKDRRNVVYVGSIWRANQPEMARLANHCIERGLVFEQYGRHLAQTPLPDHPDVQSYAGSVSMELNADVVREALLAPALQGAHQLQNPPETGNYVPCRVFKNISYGAWGVTNNRTVHELLDEGLIFDDDVAAMLDAGVEHARGHVTRAPLLPLMERVAADHTYLNRLETMLRFAVRRAEHVGAQRRSAVTGTGPLELVGRRLAYRVAGWRWS